MKKLFDITSPQELLNFMSLNIRYGYLGKSGRIYHYDDKDFNDKWYDEYVLEDANQVFENLVGNCWDQVELERFWFLKNGYEVKTIFEIVNLNYDNNYPSHSYLVYKDYFGKWNWFENADFNNQGIHSFNTFEELINFQYQKYLELLKSFNIKEEELNKIIIIEFSKPKSGISASEYLNHVLNSKKEIKIR